MLQGWDALGGVGRALPQEMQPCLSQKEPGPAWRWQGLDSCHIPTLCLEIGFPAEMVSQCHNLQVPSFSTQAAASSSVCPKASPLLLWGPERKDTEYSGQMHRVRAGQTQGQILPLY